MKINRIEIFGYGKWTDMSMSFEGGEPVLIAGNNEAGKSTILSFIYAVLFGFPTGQFPDMKPKTSSGFGGMIEFKDSDDQLYKITRKQGSRKAGQVTIEYPSGETAGAEGVTAFLGGLDAGSFQGIFLIDLEGVSKLAALKPEHMNEYLYDAGFERGKMLSNIEQDLSNEKAALFKPSGRKPELNQLLEEHHAITRQVSEAERLLDGLKGKRMELEELTASRNDTDTELRDVETERRRMTLADSFEPVIREWYSLKDVYTQDDIEQADSFPEDGLARLTHMEDAVIKREAKLHDLEKEKQALNQEMETIRNSLPDRETMERLSDLEKEESLYQHRRNEREQLNTSLHEKRLQQEAIEAKWESMPKEVFEQAVADGYHLHQFETLKQDLNRLKLDERHFEKRLQEIEGKQNQVQVKQAAIQEEMLNEEEIASIKSDLLNYEAFEKQEEEHRRNIKALEREEEQKERLDQEIRQLESRMRLIGIGGLVLSVITFFVADLLAASVPALITALWLGLTFFDRRKKQVEYKRFLERVDALQDTGTRENSPYINADELQRTLKNHERSLYRLENAEEEARELAQEMEQVKKDLQNVQNSLTDWGQRRDEWLSVSGFPETGDILVYDYFLADFREWKRIETEKSALERQMSVLTEWLEAFENRVHQALRALEDTVAEVTAMYDKEVWNQLAWLAAQKQSFEASEKRLEELKHLYAETDRAAKVISGERTRYEDDIEALFDAADVRDKESFRKKARQTAEIQEVAATIEACLRQLKGGIPDHVERALIIRRVVEMNESVQERLSQLESRYTELQQERDRIIEAATALTKDIQELEKDGSHEELLFKLRQTEAQMDEKINRLLVIETARDMLHRVRNTYEKERQPAVIARAQSYIQKLTDGKYTGFYIPAEGNGFMVEDHRGMTFSPSELSRGTCELLYLALRFSLALDESFSHAFPIVIDEAFVNLDRNRRTKMLELVRELSASRQILMMTCHDWFEEEVKAMMAVNVKTIS
uniref:SMC domain protein n=1 Tax=Bacillus selenitireducens (strain ATCC 700615 / DSM 15326 / MLS10) TaxID=439292 RepID=D6XX19_BACIE|nr:AAA family ATPase [Salisediminibacterium selenitireducens]ADH99995.1 SMC domain protein [[Bacillus] selenitireducens MLS10]